MTTEYPPFWIIWNPAGAHPPSYRHYSYQSAQSEADRLAKTYRGHTFIVLRAISECKISEVQWKRYESDRAVNEEDIPF